MISITKICAFCGEEFIKKPKEAYKKFYKRRCCNKSCESSYRWHILGIVPKGGGFQVGHPDFRENKRCWLGKKFSEETKNKMSIASKGGKWSEEAREKVSGENSHLWKGGITPESKMQRVRFRNELQKKVLKRDNYTCQICGKTNCDIHVDHIKSWSKFPEERFNMDNCRTLCMECHYEETFGREVPVGMVSWGRNLVKRSV